MLLSHCLGTAACGTRRRIVAANYIIRGHDVLVITSYVQPELSGKFVVETDGTFSFPMLGRFQVAGMTLREAEAELRDQLVERGLFTKPQVTVAVDQYRSQKVFVLGEVRKPGVHTLSGTMRLVEALALADSTLPTSGGEAVILPAWGGAEDQSVVRINLRDLENGKLAQNVTSGMATPSSSLVRKTYMSSARSRAQGRTRDGRTT